MTQDSEESLLRANDSQRLRLIAPVATLPASGRRFQSEAWYGPAALLKETAESHLIWTASYLVGRGLWEDVRACV